MAGLRGQLLMVLYHGTGRAHQDVLAVKACTDHMEIFTSATPKDGWNNLSNKEVSILTIMMTKPPLFHSPIAQVISVIQ